MILVDILVPMLEECYDFELDEGTAVGELLNEIGALLAQKENLNCRKVNQLQLYAFSQENVLRKEESLKQAGVQSGDRLALI